MDYKRIKEAYTELATLLHKYPDVFAKDSSIMNHKDIIQLLAGYATSEMFGIPFYHYSSYDHWYTVVHCTNSSDQYVGFFDHNRDIGCPSDGRQPVGEWLYMVRFSTGAYSLSADYPRQTFKAMFDEMVEIGAKYVDYNNSALYFSDEGGVAKEAYEKIPSIFEKYRGLVEEELRQQRKEKLLMELEKLNQEGV